MSDLTCLHPDAELVAVCAEHAINRATYNREGGERDLDDDPLWAAYERTRDAITEAVPHTLDGMLAKARAAKAEATHPDGTENPENCPAARWAWDLVNDLLGSTQHSRRQPQSSGSGRAWVSSIVCVDPSNALRRDISTSRTGCYGHSETRV